MKSIKTFVAIIALVTFSDSFTVQTAIATGSTLESAEAKIAVQTERAGVNDYKTTQTYTGNCVRMTAELLK